MRIRSFIVMLLCAAVSTPALAGFSHADNMKLCRNVRTLVRGEYQHHLFAVPPAVSDIMVAAMDGKTTTVREGLAGLPKSHRARWRQSALSLAALGDHSATVRALIADGADPSARSWIPPHTQRFYRQTLAAMKKGPRPDMTKLVAAMQKAGLIQNKGQWDPPPLFHAAQCNQVTLIATLLSAGAPVSSTARPHGKGVDALTVAVIDGNAGATRVLLDHGASPCLDDHRLVRRARQLHRNHVMTVARIGRMSGLPADLVARLQCHAQ